MRQAWSDERATDREVHIHQGQVCRSGRCAGKATELTWGGLCRVPRAGTAGARTDLIAAQESADGCRLRRPQSYLGNREVAEPVTMAEGLLEAASRTTPGQNIQFSGLGERGLTPRCGGPESPAGRNRRCAWRENCKPRKAPFAKEQGRPCVDGMTIERPRTT